MNSMEMPVRVAETGDEIQYFGLDRHVQRRGRLVGDDDLRPGGKRPGDGDALALTAGKLVRIAPRHVGLEAHLLEQVDSHLRCGTATRLAVDDDRLGDGAPDGEARIER